MSLDPTWQIIPPGATVPVTAASLGISALARRRQSLAADTVTVTAGGLNADAAPLFAYGQTVTVLRVVTSGNTTATTPWFVGFVTQTPATGNGSAQSQTYTLSGPWWYLDHLTYRQQWNFPGIGATESFIGRLILGQDLDGTLLTSGAVITEALQYAIHSGAPFQIGPIPTTPPLTRCSATVALGTLIPLDEVKDVTCTEVFRKMARWMPDCVSWFDYATTPPTLWFQPGGAGGTATLTQGVAPLVSVGQLTPRHDLQAPAVVIHYEVTTTSNGAASTSLLTDSAVAAGVTLAANQDPATLFGAVVLTIPMRGSTSTSIQQRVNTVAIKDTVGASGLVDYLAGRCDALAADVNDPSITADGITITACSRTWADPSADAFDPSTGEYGAQAGYLDSLGFELVDGAVTEWMAKLYNIQTQDQVITFSWTADSSASGGDPSLEPKQASIRLKATNASAQLYTMLTGYTPADAIISGLAAFYLGTISALQWSGSVVLEEPAAGVAAPLATLGNTLNIAGSANVAWAAMNALIVGEEADAATGRTTLTLGPPMHLSPQDLVARLYITRPGGTGGREGSGAHGTNNSDARTSGQPAGSNSVPGATQFPVKSGGTLLSGPGAAPTPLSPYLIDSTHSGVTYGTVCGAQPGGFAAGGTPPFSLAVSGTGYLYATATYDFANLVWTGAAVVANTNASMANTSTVAYALIGSYTSDGAGNLTVVSALAGDVDFDPSQLADDNGT